MYKLLFFVFLLFSINVKSQDSYGYKKKYLPLNVFNGKNILTQELINLNSLKSNTHYVVQYDYDLQGKVIEIPCESVLVFDGGSFSNGTLIINNSFIEAGLVEIFKENLTVIGKPTNCNIYPEWFGEKYGFERSIDFFLSESNQTLPTNKTIKLSGKSYLVHEPIIINKPIRIEGEGWNTSIKYVGTKEIESIFTFEFDESIQNSAPYSTISKLIIVNNVKNNSNGTLNRLAKRAIYGDKISACTLEWLRITNFEKAIDIAYGWNNKILYTILNDNDIAINTRADSNNVLLVDGCSINNNIIGMVAVAGKTINILNTAFEANNLAIYINHYANTVNVKNCYFERNGIRNYLIGNCNFKSDIFINGSSSISTFSHEFLCKNINIQECSIQNQYNDAFVTIVSGEGINISNNCITKLDSNKRKYIAAQLHTIGYARTNKITAKNNIGFDNSFSVFQGGNVKYNQAFSTWKSDEEPINYAVENLLEWKTNNDAIKRNIHNGLYKNNWLISNVIFPVNEKQGMVYFDIDLDDYPELAGKLLNFGFWCNGNSDKSQIQISINYGSCHLIKNYTLTLDYKERQTFFTAPSKGIIRIGINRIYSGGIDTILKLTKVYLCVVGADINLIPYKFTKPYNYNKNN